MIRTWEALRSRPGAIIARLFVRRSGNNALAIERGDILRPSQLHHYVDRRTYTLLSTCVEFPRIVPGDRDADEE